MGLNAACMPQLGRTIRYDAHAAPIGIVCKHEHEGSSKGLPGKQRMREKEHARLATWLDACFNRALWGRPRQRQDDRPIRRQRWETQKLTGFGHEVVYGDL